MDAPYFATVDEKRFADIYVPFTPFPLRSKFAAERGVIC
ncbi:hypothetical protein EDC28_10772 [Gallaecimonas pentaromativorans]|uniref:Uncharacterized protein n=1 Tax=Gallaecimonas pentaromativorans TaxID=584787 RepID=A0A3N1P9S8_9GAMM|nr:hypothetical protein EDC28_10772 [Gallaecimonas pentaromativorans]